MEGADSVIEERRHLMIIRVRAFMSNPLPRNTFPAQQARVNPPVSHCENRSALGEEPDEESPDRP
jgi:hypothetical protein